MVSNAGVSSFSTMAGLGWRRPGTSTVGIINAGPGVRVGGPGTDCDEIRVNGARVIEGVVEGSGSVDRLRSVWREAEVVGEEAGSGDVGLQERSLLIWSDVWDIVVIVVNGSLTVLNFDMGGGA